FVATNKSIICHANLQIKLETFSHTQQASKYTQSNGAETALTKLRQIFDWFVIGLLVPIGSRIAKCKWLEGVGLFQALLMAKIIN
ncbi:hypothetical protein, partial [Agrobacterium vitis]|uniref:hypothetical protein n=4 Tax=Rhizobiaceae TaxID=82115 RepID=UPI001AEEC65A